MPSPKPFQQPLSEMFLPSRISHPLSDLGALNPKRKWEEDKAIAL